MHIYREHCGVFVLGRVQTSVFCRNVKVTSPSEVLLDLIICGLGQEGARSGERAASAADCW